MPAGEERMQSSEVRRPKRHVAIGSSAGGLRAIEDLLDHLECNTDMAFYVAQHLSPDFENLIDQLLKRHTNMRVVPISDSVDVEANCVYLLPQGREVLLTEQGLRLETKRSSARQASYPIDDFFATVAQNAGANSVGIILSGTGIDGANGVREIHSAGGLVMAQSFETATFDGMPRAAYDTGATSLVLSPKEIAKTLNRLNHDNAPQKASSPPKMKMNGQLDPTIRFALELLQDQLGFDFSGYNAEMIYRRVARRVKLNDLNDICDYVDFLKSDHKEVDLLYDDMLIGVTDFFRDTEVFDSLQSEIIPGAIQRLGPTDEFRCWIAGTATGEEAYSVAMLLAEELEKQRVPNRARIFASDVHDGSLAQAGKGVYLHEQMRCVSPARRERFFIERQNGFYVAPELRKMVVFTPHNVINDAPFTRLDLVCCRNVLIYFTRQTQQRVLSLLHFGLKKGGVLCLGNSESLGDLRDEFVPVDESLRIFRKHRELSPEKRARTRRRIDRNSHVPPKPPEEKTDHRRLISIYDQLLQRMDTPSIVVNGSREILHILGGAGKLLDVKDGRPTNDLLKSIHGDLRSACSVALLQFRDDQRPVVLEPVSCKIDDRAVAVKIRADLIAHEKNESAILIRFDCETLDAEEQPRARLTAAEIETIEELERELHFTQDSLQSTIEELQSTNEELQSTNEQLTASNEELQSTNEELHSVNEELYTVNAEHQRKIDELTELNDDIDNLLTTTNVHTLFLDSDLRLRRFTPNLADIFTLIPQDIGRPISSFTHRLLNIDLVKCIEIVINTESSVQREVKDQAGNWYLLRIFPYMARGVVDGAVVTMVNVTTLQSAREALQRSEERFDLAVTGSNAGIWDWRNVKEEPIWCSSRVYSLLGHPPGEEMTISLWQELVHPDDYDDFIKSLFDHLNNEVPFDLEFRMEHAESKLYRWFHIRGAAERAPNGSAMRMAGSLEDVTDRRTAEDEVKRGVQRRDQFLAMLSHELRNPLGAVTNAVAVLSNDRTSDQHKSHAIDVVQRQLRQVTTLLDDLLDVSRITHGKFELREGPVDLRGTVELAINVVQNQIEDAKLGFSVEIGDQDIIVNGDSARLQQVVVNLLTNAIKYTDNDGDVYVGLRAEEDQAVLVVRDTGVGIPEEKLEEIFQLFYQSDETLDRSDGGMGVGLTLVKAVVELHGGDVSVASNGIGHGSTFSIRLPLVEEPESDPSHDDSSKDDSHIRSVVLVEDLDDAREMLASLLLLEGLEVHKAANGLEGLKLVQSVQPDAAIIDIGLPEMDGHEVAQAIRKDDCLKDIRLVALTGYGQDSDRREVAASGFDLHLVKPLNPAKLGSILASLSRNPSGGSSEIIG